MIPFLFLLLLGPEEELAQARKDSLIIYRAYKESIDILKRTTDPDQWYALEDSLSRVTACSFLRLSQLNKESYQPIAEYNKEGMGVAYAFPEPSDAWLNDLRTADKQRKIAVAEAAVVKKEVAKPVVAEP